MTANKLAILYDGECPFCRNYCALVRLKEVVDEVELIDARIPSALLAEVTARFKNSLFWVPVDEFNPTETQCVLCGI